MAVSQRLADLFDLSGRVALVTGASSGLGRHMAGTLAAAGARVVLVARREKELAEAAAEISALSSESAMNSGEAAALAGDLTTADGVAAVAENAAKPFGAPQILINAAGINLRQRAEDVTPESWEQTLAVNLTAPFLLARDLVGPMKENGWGRIINMTSLQSERAFPGGIAYGATKGGLAQLTRAMAVEWSAAGINCNAITPGFFPTELTRPVFDDAEAAAKTAAQTAIGRNGRLEDLDGLTIFLASPASDYITGQVIHIDGGFSAK